MTASDPLRFAAFDLDGTLIDSAATIVEGVLACWAACGFPEPDRDAVRSVTRPHFVASDSVEIIQPT